MSKPIPYPKLHTTSGRAYLYYRGKYHYFGKYGSAEADARYWQWRAALAGHPAPASVRHACLVSDLLQAYRTAHLPLDGKVKSRLNNVEAALGPLARLQTTEYGPLAFQEHRRRLLATGTRCARQVNDLAQFVQRIFRWGVSRQLVTLEVWSMLKTVERLKDGDSPKRTRRREPVPASVVNATLPHLLPHCADMVRLIVATGARPGEVLSLRAEEVVKEYHRAGWWFAEKTKHKTSNRGKKRWVEFPPEVQPILRDRWPGEGQGWFFPASFDPGHFRVASLRQHIGHVCRANRIPPWHPYQLRHLRLTDLAGTEGLRAATQAAGHGSVRTTMIYLHQPPRAS
jgi:integrase